MAEVKPGMIGYYGKTHHSLDSLIDLETFDALQVDIWKGMAEARPVAFNGTLSKPIADEDMSYDYYFKPVWEAYREYNLLPDTDPIKIAGEELLAKHTSRSVFATYLKYAFGAHDQYYHYHLWADEPGWKSNPDRERKYGPSAEYFPSLIKWIDNLVTIGVFKTIGRAYISAMESGGVSFEHRDAPSDKLSDTDEEFIHIRGNYDRPFYVYNPVAKEKYYFESRVSWWNDKDVHGGDVSMSTTFAVRVDGIYTDEFRNKIKNV